MTYNSVIYWIIGILNLGKKSCQDDVQRIPEEYEGVQANTCKNPKCKNFGLESPSINKPNKNSTERQVKSRRDPLYALSGLAKKTLGLKYKECGDIILIKSNGGGQEKERLGSYLVKEDVSCTRKGCGNEYKPVVILIYTAELGLQVVISVINAKPVAKPSLMETSAESRSAQRLIDNFTR